MNRTLINEMAIAEFNRKIYGEEIKNLSENVLMLSESEKLKYQEIALNEGIGAMMSKLFGAYIGSLMGTAVGSIAGWVIVGVLGFIFPVSLLTVPVVVGTSALVGMIVGWVKGYRRARTIIDGPETTQLSNKLLEITSKRDELIEDIADKANNGIDVKPLEPKLAKLTDNQIQMAQKLEVAMRKEAKTLSLSDRNAIEEILKPSLKGKLTFIRK